MKIQYIEKSFHNSSLLMIQQANEIIEEYQAEDLNLTLRQLYYQFVSRDLIANKQKEYHRLGSIISDARLAGLIDWYAIVDRTRNLKGNYHFDDPGDAIEETARDFKIDHWENQRTRVECWIEKEALIGVIERICVDLDIDFFACKGYVSQSELWRAAMRLKRYENNGQETILIHLGDHDPSGIDMTRDINERLHLFGASTSVRRIALNWNQIEEFNPPPNPAKLSDSRAKSYISEHGYNSWELDALEPRVLRDLIRDEVDGWRDLELWEMSKEREQKYLSILNRVKQNWQSL